MYSVSDLQKLIFQNLIGTLNESLILRPVCNFSMRFTNWTEGVVVALVVDIIPVVAKSFIIIKDAGAASVSSCAVTDNNIKLLT